MEFCCCAVPLVNAGAYFLVLEFAFVALVTAILALAPPQIVATMNVIPSWSKSLVAALGFITFFWQPLGLFAIAKQKSGLYRLYIRINFLLTCIVLACTAAFLAVSAARHNEALDACTAVYGNTPASSGTGIAVSQATSALDGSGRTICNVLTWAQVGTMGGLIVLMGLTQLYMCFAQRAYGQQQREARGNFEKYRYSPANNGGPDSIPLAARDSAVWEPREDEYGAGAHYGPGYSPYGPPAHGMDHHSPYGDRGSPETPEVKGGYDDDYPSYRPQPASRF
ncbi:uncharacterized protein PSFLO_00205 [Pseudozyma flocculosa]|uniref:MARVEL domain-containing protein n=2 Tax=Pseudozyma flocculosa TaxID=84751 RepID=A0A5C3EQT0_9BASI|nr:uncharacterized protein PSFLO_00205 [Pseudozyma flocculosa]